MSCRPLSYPAHSCRTEHITQLPSPPDFSSPRPPRARPPVSFPSALGHSELTPLCARPQQILERGHARPGPHAAGGDPGRLRLAHVRAHRVPGEQRGPAAARGGPGLRPLRCGLTRSLSRRPGYLRSSVWPKTPPPATRRPPAPCPWRRDAQIRVGLSIRPRREPYVGPGYASGTGSPGLRLRHYTGATVSGPSERPTPGRFKPGRAPAIRPPSLHRTRAPA